ncbi:MAG: methylated-DNA--[Firmicutes bacterium]|nr:methylated-DNA--[protein]-cysteine S-methyltransferase [Bacillota bacterium]
MTTYELPRGTAALIERAGRLVRVEFVRDESDLFELANEYEVVPGEGTVLEEAKRELDEYFDERRKTFDVPLAAEGTPFQKAVWAELAKIPYGEYRSYKQIAEALGDTKKARPVGRACHTNPLPLFVPCHRVIASDGTLGGFGGGLELKYYLLMLEGAI